jgi:hypothetical protein
LAGKNISQKWSQARFFGKYCPENGAWLDFLGNKKAP